MRGSLKVRLVLSAVAATAALAVAGCGGSSDSSSDPASLAPPKAPLFIEASVRPEGELKCQHRVPGQEHRRDRRSWRPASSPKSKARPATRAKQSTSRRKSNPGSAKRAASSSRKYDGNDFEGYGVAIQTTDTAATQDFIDKQSEESDEVPKEGSYEGVDYRVQADDGTTIGIVGDFLVFAEDTATFKQMVDASDGESLADEESLLEHRRRRSQRQLRRCLRRHRRSDRPVRRHGRPRSQAVPRQRRHRPRGSDRRRQPDPRLRPGRDRLQQQSQRQEPADRRRLAAARLAARQLLCRHRLRRLRRPLRGSDRPDRRQRHPR